MVGFSKYAQSIAGHSKAAADKAGIISFAFIRHALEGQGESAMQCAAELQGIMRVNESVSLDLYVDDDNIKHVQQKVQHKDLTDLMDAKQTCVQTRAMMLFLAVIVKGVGEIGQATAWDPKTGCDVAGLSKLVDMFHGLESKPLKDAPGLGSYAWSKDLVAALEEFKKKFSLADASEPLRQTEMKGAQECLTEMVPNVLRGKADPKTLCVRKLQSHLHALMKLAAWAPEATRSRDTINAVKSFADLVDHVQFLDAVKANKWNSMKEMIKDFRVENIGIIKDALAVFMEPNLPAQAMESMFEIPVGDMVAWCNERHDALLRASQRITSNLQLHVKKLIGSFKEEAKGFDEDSPQEKAVHLKKSLDTLSEKVDELKTISGHLS